MMPGGRGRARRSCPLCKPYKFAGNAGGSDGRYTAREQAERDACDDEIEEVLGDGSDAA